MNKTNYLLKQTEMKTTTKNGKRPTTKQHANKNNYKIHKIKHTN